MRHYSVIVRQQWFWESKAVYCWSGTNQALVPFLLRFCLLAACLKLLAWSCVVVVLAPRHSGCSHVVVTVCYSYPSCKSSPDISSASYTSGNRRNLLPRTRFVPLSKSVGQNFSKICSLSNPFPRTQARLPFLVSRLKRALDLPMP